MNRVGRRTRERTDGRPCIVIAGGGTGGHVFPGLALADALRHLADVDVIFAGTARGLETRVMPARGYALELLEVGPIKGGGAARVVAGAATAALATVYAARLVRRLSPRAVVSVGGYPAGPVSLAAALQSVPLAIVEPNSVVGLANRLLAPFAKRAFVAWTEAAGAFRGRIVRPYGVPLREGFRPSAYTPSSPPRVLVLGGSQGATALNERLPDALARVVRDLGPIEVVHQTGRGREAAVRAAYARERFERAEVVPFVDEVAQQLVRADLVVARAGAVSLAEIAAVGRPALLIPFPLAADDHQGRNAEAMARAGGAVCVRQEAADAGRLARELARLLRDTDLRGRMAACAHALGKPHAATDTAGDLLRLAGIAPCYTGPSRRDTNGAGQSSYLEVN